MTRPLKPENIVYDIANASDPQLSPAGDQVLYSLSQATRNESRAHSQLWLSDRNGEHAQQILESVSRPGNGRWSPEGDRIVFTHDVEGDSVLSLLDRISGEIRELTRLTTPIGEVTFSPTGTAIAFVAAFDPDNPNDQRRAADAPPRVRVVKRIDYKQDNRGFLGDVRRQVWVLDLGSLERRMVSLDPVDCAFPAWSPDGNAIAVRLGTNNGMSSQLAVIDLITGEQRIFGEPEGNVATWAWSPDGRNILYSGDSEQTWQSDHFLIDLSSGDVRRLTDDLPCQPDPGFPTLAPPSQPIWVDDRMAVFHAIHRGASGIWQIDTETGAVEQLADSESLGSGFQSDAGNRWFVQSRASLEQPGNVALYDRQTNDWRVITHHNDAFFSTRPAAEWEKFEVERNGWSVDTWLLKPPGFDANKRYPVVLDIHGGPNAWYGYGFTPMQQALAGGGNLVVFSNPRGSGSYGREFTQAVRQDWGGEDYLDLLAVLDSVLERPYADPERIGVYGYSYGGFMSSWMLGHSDRFRAAVIGAPVVNLVSFYGTADIGHRFGPLQIGGNPDNNLDEYLFRSPITYLANCKAPVLILHGEADDRVPISQGEELYVALLDAGCEVEFVRYPQASHASLTRSGFPSHRFDYLERLVGWFATHLQ